MVSHWMNSGINISCNANQRPPIPDDRNLCQSLHTPVQNDMYIAICQTLFDISEIGTVCLISLSF